jgi:hypothetical protein
MIPSLLLPGLIAGRWWLVPIAAVGWPVLLMVGAIATGWQFGASAGALAAANVAFAVAVHRGAAYLLPSWRDSFTTRSVTRVAVARTVGKRT